jgi:hypothetical protein
MNQVILHIVSHPLLAFIYPIVLQDISSTIFFGSMSIIFCGLFEMCL